MAAVGLMSLLSPAAPVSQWEDSGCANRIKGNTGGWVCALVSHAVYEIKSVSDLESLRWKEVDFLSCHLEA